MTAAPQGRLRSARRLPAALAALVLLTASVVLLYDLVAARADRPAMWWRRGLGGLLDRHTLEEGAVLLGGALAVLTGLGLLLLALTPGLRGVLSMRAADPGARAGLGRRAAGLVLRDRAMEVPGVQSVRVRMGRTRVAVRAASHFRELDEVRADLEHVLAVGIEELGLAQEPELHVRVSRPARKG
ncbi:DUF6286 domain-containing protein [Streptomyces sp. NPDC002054]|uniref:DUF6286 domain-containing protein n=1 Tax=Streptomyces sp. NPDC002054 TaxID=3154663 RepID=UPI0033209323